MKAFLFLGVLLGLHSQINAQTTVFNETFETNSPTVNSWTKLNLDSNTANWILFNGTSATASMGFAGRSYFSASIGLTPDNVLISPAIALPTGTLSLTYQIAAYDTTKPAEHYAVYILPSGNLFTGSETPVFEETLTVAQAAVATTRTVNITASAGQNSKIYFRHYNTTNQYGLLLDNVKIAQATLGTLEAVSAEQIGIYPNPTTDFIRIKSKTKVMNAEVYDISGRKVNTSFNDDKVDVRNLQSGNYILKTETKEGVISQKFIKK